MISLPPGVTISYNIKIVIRNLNIEIFEWFRDVGARVWVEDKPFNLRGIAKEMPMVQFGQAKPSYHLQDGSGNVMLNFNSEDAGTALAFLIKFNTEDSVTQGLKVVKEQPKLFNLVAQDNPILREVLPDFNFDNPPVNPNACEPCFIPVALILSKVLSPTR